MRKTRAARDNFVWKPERTWGQVCSRFALRIVIPTIAGFYFIQTIAVPVRRIVASSISAMLP